MIEFYGSMGKIFESIASAAGIWSAVHELVSATLWLWSNQNITTNENGNLKNI